MNPEDIDKKEYEIAVLLGSEADLPGVLTFIGQHHGEISLEPKTRNLALSYEIKGRNDAVFAYCNFRASGEDVKTLEHDLNSRPDVLRYLIIASPPPAEKMGSSMGMGAMKRRGRPARSVPPGEAPKPVSQPLSNEALEKKIEEILQ